MGQPYVGEIRMFGGNFAPAGWMFCNGQTLPISEYSTLFNLIGTTYGGDGQQTFQLPNLQGRTPLHTDGTFQLGQSGGAETVTLTTQQMPSHSHAYTANTAAGNASSPQSNIVASSTTIGMYFDSAAKSAMGPNSIGPNGGNQPHENLQPFLCVSFIISLFGIYPSPT